MHDPWKLWGAVVMTEQHLHGPAVACVQQRGCRAAPLLLTAVKTVVTGIEMCLHFIES